MSKKFSIKITVDAAMTVLLLLLMARQITGDVAHEWLGAGMFVLWIIHHILNINWYKNLTKGRYTPYRIVHTLINFGVLLSMLGLMVSGIILSRQVFFFLNISGGIAIVRSLHIFSAFWGYVLMALHLGLHWGLILKGLKKVIVVRITGKQILLYKGTGFAIAVYGLYASVKKQLMDYLFIQSSFVFFDFDQPAWMFFIDYIAIMGLFIFLGYYAKSFFLSKK